MKKQSTIKDNTFKTSQRELPNNASSTIHLDKTKIVNSKANNERKVDKFPTTINREEDKAYASSIIHSNRSKLEKPIMQVNNFKKD